jgi:hypothetical protein
MKKIILRENIRNILHEEVIKKSNTKKIILEYTNGNIPESELVKLDLPSGGKSSAMLNSKAAKDFNDMVKAAKEEGVNIEVSQGYRPKGSKEKGCSEGFTQWCAWIKYKNGTGNLAAVPGTSNHGSGAAIDVRNCKKGGKVHTWLTQNASKFNFRPFYKEAWHWDHSSSGSVKSSADSASSKGSYGSSSSSYQESDSEDLTVQGIIDNIRNMFGKKTDNTSDESDNNISNSEESNKNTNKDSKNKTSGDVILMGGLDYRPGDLNITQQINVVKEKLPKKNVIGFRYSNLKDTLKAIKDNPDAYVILFSAGCNYSSEIAKTIKNKDRLFIVEPYASSKNTSNSVKSAVSSGVPSSNVVTGAGKPRGEGVVSGATKTPSSYDHWGALKFVTTLIK